MITEITRMRDAFRRNKPGRKKLPPFDEIFVQTPERVARYMGMGAFGPNDRILDVGCAWGTLLLGLPASVEYVGVDCNAPSIRIAREVFGDRGEFQRMDVAAPKYNPAGRIDGRDVRFPADDASFDAALCCSLFTHFTVAAEVAAYLAEIRRVLKPGGKLLATWFRAPPNKPGGNDRRHAFNEFEIRRLLAGWTWLHDEGGTTTGHDDQWHTLTQS